MTLVASRNDVYDESYDALIREREIDQEEENGVGVTRGMRFVTS